jgi:type IV secretory pathway VirJ component
VTGAAFALGALLAAVPAAAAAQAEPSPGVADLPLVEVRAGGDDPRLAILLTGDGGWVGLDRALAAELAEAGVATVGLDSLRYFWKRRTPDETARDVARIVAHYGAAWRRTEVVLVGYSRGADIVPFLVPRLPPDARARLRLVAMLGPGTFAEFEVHAVDLLAPVRRPASLPTEDAVRATEGAVPMLCVHGTDEGDSLCPRLADLPWVKLAALPGGHHFGRRYREVARLVLDATGERVRAPAPNWPR